MINNIREHIQNNSKVISLEYGVGEIVGKSIMYDCVDDFLEVLYYKDQKVRYFSFTKKNDMRLLSPKMKVESALKALSTKLSDESVHNEFDEMNAKFDNKNVCFIVKRIVDLLRRDDRSPEDNLLLDLSIQSLTQEVGQVYQVDKIIARGIVSDFMKSA